MIEYYIQRGKRGNKYYLAVYMNEPDAIQPLAEGIDNFFELYNLKMKLSEEKKKGSVKNDLERNTNTKQQAVN